MMLQSIFCIFKKEFSSYFRTKLAYFVMAIYAILTMLTTFYSGYYFEIDNNSLFSLFYLQPEILTILVPVLTMKLWADERRFGTLEMILAQPLSYTSLVLAKFMAAWSFCALLLMFTFPLWATTIVFGQTDDWQIFYNYFSCWLMAGALCALGCVVSSFNANPIVAYIMSIFVIWMLKICNFDYFIKIAKVSNELVVRMSQSLNFDRHFESMISGQPAFNNIIYFVSIMVFALWLNVISVEYKRG